jgi:transcriptional regulator with XRE-family HTH domain
VGRQPRQDLIALGKAIHEIRMRRGFSVSELARAAGVPSKRLAAIEDGRLDPSLELLWKLDEGLGVDWSVFYKRARELEAEGPDGSSGDVMGGR